MCIVENAFSIQKTVFLAEKHILTTVNIDNPMFHMIRIVKYFLVSKNTCRQCDRDIHFGGNVV